MIEAEWWDYESASELADAVAGDVGFIIESALDARGDAVIAVPVDDVSMPILEKLAKQKLKWKNVTIFPTDDRLVSVSDPLAKVTPLAKLFLPLGARVMPLGSENADHKAAGKAADARLQDLHWPPDLIWLGIGSDGHTAAIYPGPDMDEALNGPKERRALGVKPDPMPQDAPVARASLTRAAIASARSLMIVTRGNDRKLLLEQAIEDGISSPLAVGRVLADLEQPIDIHWCA